MTVTQNNNRNKGASITSSNGTLKLGEELKTLIADRKNWEDGVYKTSNDKLYEILAKCLDIYQRLKDDTERRAQLREMLLDRGIPHNASTKLATRIVRLVFDNVGNRSFAYARTLMAADEAHIDAMALAKWIRANGGVEQVRRAANGGLTQAKKDDAFRSIATETLAQSKPLVGAITQNSELMPSIDNDHAFALALVRRESDGTLSIVRGTTNATLINKFLSLAGKELKGAKAVAQEEDERRKHNAERDRLLTMAA